MSVRLITLTALALIATLASCNKDDEAPDMRPGYRRILSSGDWQISKYMRYIRVNDNRVDTVNELRRIRACGADDVYRFTTADSSAGGILLIDEGLTKCDSTLPQQRPSQQWIIPHPEAKSFMISHGKVDRIYALEALSELELQLHRAESFNIETGRVESQLLVFKKMF